MLSHICSRWVGNDEKSDERHNRREIPRLRRPTLRKSEGKEKASASFARNDSFGAYDVTCVSGFEFFGSKHKRAGDGAAADGIRKRAAELADVFGGLCGAAVQCVGAN